MNQSRTPHSNASANNRILFIHMSGMGWLRLVGSLESQVSFAEYRLFYRALLQKRPITLRSLLIVATPFRCLVSNPTNVRVIRMSEWVTNSIWMYTFICLVSYPSHSYQGSKPLTWNKISEIFKWQKCFSELKISNPRILCTLNGVRRSSWKVVWVAKWSYASETSVGWQILTDNRSFALLSSNNRSFALLSSNNRSFAHAAGRLWMCANKKNQISSLCLDRFCLLANYSGIVFWYFNTLSCILL